MKKPAAKGRKLLSNFTVLPSFFDLKKQIPKMDLEK